MKIKCRYCGSNIDSSYDVCPNCGAVNADVVRSANSQPHTIQELEQWYADHHLPPYEVTRFFINKDIREPKCFGIYRQPDGNVVVYKNKSDGSRAVRYEGPDEEFAVNELYQKLKEEIVNQKEHNVSNQSGSRNASGGGKKSGNLLGIKIFLIIFGVAFGIQLLTVPIILFSSIFSIGSSKHDDVSRNKRVRYDCDSGYYNYDDEYYYFSNNMNTWWYYDDSEDDWVKTYEVDEELADNWEDYTSWSDEFSKDYENGKTYHEWFKEGGQSYSDNGHSYSYSDDDWDSGSSWDSNDSWDSGYTDWDSDW